MTNLESAYRILIEKILKNEIKDQNQLNLAKKEISSKFHLSSLIKNSQILAAAKKEEKPFVIELLKIKPVRTISGVAVISAMTSPAPCPHGLCIPCPGGPSSEFHSPQSYMGQEPAAKRAFEHNFDPYKQVAARLEQLSIIGHPIEKAELIIMGGTYTSRSLCYQEWFVKRSIEAMNDFYDKTWRDNDKYVSIEKVQKSNEKAKIKNTGITIETRPDWLKTEHIDHILKLGATKVEIGVQTTYDFILSRIERGHTIKDVVEANTRLRDSGLKVGFHIMPGLPGSSYERDLSMFEMLFKDERFKPDYLKIYPTLVTKGTKLHKLWENGKYKPLEEEKAIELIANMKAMLPEWVRLQRIQRDIPAYQVISGIKKSNIRQLAKEYLEKSGKKCRCIRCREVGHKTLEGIKPYDIQLLKREYIACNGKEYFISFEDKTKDILIGFIRLRFPYSPHRKELIDAAVIRELHVYGAMVQPGNIAKENQWQHRGYGEELIYEAEKIAKIGNAKKIAIISGIGVRDYYRKLGYKQDGPYMIKYVN